MPSTRLKSPTIGIEPPAPTVTAFLPHSSASALRALMSAGLSNGSCSARRRPKLPNSTLQSAGSASRTKSRKASRIFSGFWSPTRRNDTFAEACAGNHGLGALAGIAADDAVDVAGRPRRDHARSACGPFRRPESSGRSGRGISPRQVERLQVGLDVGRQLRHAVIEARNGDAAIVVVHRRQDACASTRIGFCAAPPNTPECRSRSAQVTFTSS